MQIWRSKTSPNQKTPIALTIGNFDGVHLGHQAMLSRLRSAADRLGLAACVMTFEPHPREFFAPDQAPTRLTSLREKLEQLAVSGIDFTRVYRFNYDFAKISPEDFITRILEKEHSVRWLLVGDDFRFGSRRAGDFDLLMRFSKTKHFEVEKMTSVLIDNERVSSTRIRDALEIGDLQTAQRFLGRPYSISGRVTHGDKLGQKLGIPTANIQIRHNRPPLSGIFVVKVRGAIKSSPMQGLKGVASLGTRPTIHENGLPVLEVHLFDFNQTIYGYHLQVDFIHKLRNEEKYPDMKSLVRQINQDIIDAKAYLQNHG
ncbi:MAG: bifunctional riboflavin kinase/FAD synthetase [Nitrosomonas sp.]|nr:bifunctional riboflavin kinase/FAD synthetase [Nitrosomonas sp.]